MPDKDAGRFAVFFETSVKPGYRLLTSSQLSEIVKDGLSWFNFLQMLCGKCSALMKIEDTQGRQTMIKVVREEDALSSGTFDDY